MASSSPSPIDQELKLALQAFRSGNLTAAEGMVNELLLIYPHRADVQLAKGVLQVSQGDQVGGLESLTLALDLDPANPEALAWATLASLNLRQFEHAESLARRFSYSAPTSPRPYYLLANALRGQDRTMEALQSIDQALELAPNDPDALVTKARLLREAQLPGLAVEIYQRINEHNPNPAAAVDLAKILIHESHPDKALAVLKNGTQQMREEHRPYALIAESYTLLQNFQEAEIYWKLAEKFSPNPKSALIARSRSEIAAGRFDVAEEILTPLTSDDDLADEAFSVLTTARKMTEADELLINKISGLAKDNRLGGVRLANLQYALGKGLDDLKRYDQAMIAFDEANRICLEIYPRRRNFDSNLSKQFTDSQIAYFSKERISELAKFGMESDLPVFVVGMMRSGTTLAESILSSHSLIQSGGEQSFWLDRVVELFRGADDNLNFRHGQALDFAADYLKSIAVSEPGIHHIVDKNPSNIEIAAMLHCLFPNSKFVHMKRHAVDNLLSIWMTPVSGNVGYASTKSNLVFAYREHLRWVDHLKSVLPVTAFLSVSYEELTSQPTETITQLLNFVGVPLEEACFKPEENKRSVLTPSVHQVRQPIYQASQARWKNYEAWLGEFRDLLDAGEF